MTDLEWIDDILNSPDTLDGFYPNLMHWNAVDIACGGLGEYTVQQAQGNTSLECTEPTVDMESAWSLLPMLHVEPELLRWFG